MSLQDRTLLPDPQDLRMRMGPHSATTKELVRMRFTTGQNIFLKWVTNQSIALPQLSSHGALVT